MSVDHFFIFAVFSDALFVIFHTEPRKHGKQSLQLPVHYWIFPSAGLHRKYNYIVYATILILYIRV